MEGTQVKLGHALDQLRYPQPLITVIALTLLVIVAGAVFTRRAEPAERLHRFVDQFIDLVRGRR
jgi:hypothetical protein